MVLEDNSFWRVNSKKKISDKTSKQRVVTVQTFCVTCKYTIQRIVAIEKELIISLGFITDYVYGLAWSTSLMQSEGASPYMVESFPYTLDS